MRACVRACGHAREGTRVRVCARLRVSACVLVRACACACDCACDCACACVQRASERARAHGCMCVCVFSRDVLHCPLCARARTNVCGHVHMCSSRAGAATCYDLLQSQCWPRCTECFNCWRPRARVRVCVRACARLESGKLGGEVLYRPLVDLHRLHLRILCPRRAVSAPWGAMARMYCKIAYLSLAWPGLIECMHCAAIGC